MSRMLKVVIPVTLPILAAAVACIAFATSAAAINQTSKTQKAIDNVVVLSLPLLGMPSGLAGKQPIDNLIIAITKAGAPVTGLCYPEVTPIAGVRTTDTCMYSAVSSPDNAPEWKKEPSMEMSNLKQRLLVTYRIPKPGLAEKFLNAWSEANGNSVFCESKEGQLECTGPNGSSLSVFCSSDGCSSQYSPGDRSQRATNIPQPIQWVLIDRGRHNRVVGHLRVGDSNPDHIAKMIKRYLSKK